MDSSLREISSTIPGQASVEPRASPPNATATPLINCRRVGGFISVLGFFSSLIIVLQSCVFARTHRTTLAEYLKIIFSGENQIRNPPLKGRQGWGTRRTLIITLCQYI